MSLPTGVTPSFEIDSRARGRGDTGGSFSLRNIEDEMERSCLTEQAARALIRQQLEHLVRAFNMNPTLSSEARESNPRIRRSAHRRRFFRSPRHRCAAPRWRRGMSFGRR